MKIRLSSQRHGMLYRYQYYPLWIKRAAALGEVTK